MECARKKGRMNQSYEIHVCFPWHVPYLSLYERLRFALQVSTWFPRPLGFVLWSVLHVLLLVGGAPLLVSAVATMSVLSVLLDVIVALLIAYFKLLAVLVIIIWLSWSLIFENGRLHRIAGACSSVVAWWADASWESFSTWTLQFWKDCKQEVIKYFSETSITGDCVKYIMREWRPWCRVLRRWCEEVVHIHDVIAI